MPLLEASERQILPVQVSNLTRRVSPWPIGLRYGVSLRWLVIGLSMLGCESKTVIAAWSCEQSADGSLLGSAGSGGTNDAFPVPWSTGFENGWCDYNARGFFIEDGPQHKDIVTEPVHSGSFAAAFTVDTTNDKTGQLRCVLQGSLPKAAYYGAWYYVPTLATNTALWNLFHFQGDNNAYHGGHLWDISLVNKANGDLRLEVFSYLLEFVTNVPSQSNSPPIPIGSWFHIEMYLKRATDETGEVIVYQNGVIIFQVTNVKTDTSTSMVQWYVGNLAEKLVPSESTVYVDDVTIKATH